MSVNVAPVAESLDSEWLQFKLTSEKEPQWCYVNLLMETVAIENKQQWELAMKESANEMIHFRQLEKTKESWYVSSN